MFVGRINFIISYESDARSLGQKIKYGTHQRNCQRRFDKKRMLKKGEYGKALNEIYCLYV